MMSGLMGTMASGMAFGAGSAVAHQAVGAAASALSGSGSKEAPAPVAPAAQASGGYCDLHNEDLMACLKQPGADASACQPYFEALQACQDQAKQFA